MDVIGASELRKRIEEQQHWRQAQSVQDGRQPAADPDILGLEDIEGGVRRYACEEHEERIDGRRALVTRRLTKTLLDGWWEASLVIESVRYLDGDDGAGRRAARGA
jgi:hypothetical protein